MKVRYAEVGAHPLVDYCAQRTVSVENAVNILVERDSDSAAEVVEAGMSIVLIQVLLIAVVVAVAARLFRSGGARSQAVRRLGLLLFAGFAVVSILVPTCGTASPGSSASAAAPTWCSPPVVAFLSFTVTTYLRFREFEARYPASRGASPSTRPRASPWQVRRTEMVAMCSMSPVVETDRRGR